MAQLSVAPETRSLPAIYSRKSAAALLGISLRKLAQLVAAGELAVIRIDGRTLLSSWELLAFIERKTERAAIN